MTSRLIGCAAILGALWAGDARAEDGDAVLWASRPDKLRVDGMLRDWRAEMVSLERVLKGRKGEGAEVEVAIAYDDNNLYVALDAKDDALVRSARPADGEDHLVVRLGFPTEKGGYTAHEVRLYPGQPGKLPGAALVDGRALSTAKVVEAANAEGYQLEAAIPWSAFPEASRIRVGIRAAAEYVDASAPGRIRKAVATTAGKGPKEWPPLLTEPEQGLYTGIIRENGLPSLPARSLLGNVAGDARLEQVAIYGKYLTITGAGYREGKQFYFGDLLIRDASAVDRLELQDFDGDGHSEVLIVRRIGAEEQYRTVLQVFKIGADDSPVVAFTHEIGVTSSRGQVLNQVKVEAASGGARLVIAQGKSSGYEQSSYDQATPSDMESALLPWSTIGSRTFAWKGDALAEVSTTTWKPKAKAGGAAPAVAAVQGPAAPPPPRPPTADELLDQVYSLYRKDRKVGASKPRFDFVTDVASDLKNERVLVHDKDIVVFGKGFLDGAAYTYTTIGVARPEDIRAVTARDLTGDGKAEILVQAVLHAKGSEELKGVEVERSAFVIYAVINNRLTRVFAAETGRSMDGQMVLANIAFTPDSRGGVELSFGPGRALGWTEKSYPFPQDTTATGGLLPLPLPWSGQRRSYKFDGSAFTP
jgi:hypothetical protein